MVCNLLIFELSGKWGKFVFTLSTFYLAVANHAVFNLKNNKHKHPPDIKCSCKQVVANLGDFRAASFLEDARLYCQDLGGESLEVSGD